MANTKVLKRTGKIVAVVLLCYVALVVLFESMLGYFQPQAGNTIAITVYSDEGEAHQRIVSLLNSNDSMYVAVNHWPRAWYRQARANPDIDVTMDGNTEPYRAVFVENDSEYDRVQADNPTGIVFRFLTGFPPRYFFRLDPR